MSVVTTILRNFTENYLTLTKLFNITSVFTVITNLPAGNSVAAPGQLGTDPASLAKFTDRLFVHQQNLGRLRHGVNNIQL